MACRRKVLPVNRPTLPSWMKDRQQRCDNPDTDQQSYPLPGRPRRTGFRLEDKEWQNLLSWVVRCTGRRFFWLPVGYGFSVPDEKHHRLRYHRHLARPAAAIGNPREFSINRQQDRIPIIRTRIPQTQRFLFFFADSDVSLKLTGASTSSRVFPAAIHQ